VCEGGRGETLREERGREWESVRVRVRVKERDSLQRKIVGNGELNFPPWQITFSSLFPKQPFFSLFLGGYFSFKLESVQVLVIIWLL
jgi:hypothetical protein